MTNLDAFRDDEITDGEYQNQGSNVDVLVFLLGDRRFAIRATAVDSIVPWIEPSAIPAGASAVLGVVQDRGRLVVAVAQEPRDARPTRLIICRSSRGLVGVGATSTQVVGAVRVFTDELVANRPVDSDAGVLTLLDPEELAGRGFAT